GCSCAAPARARSASSCWSWRPRAGSRSASGAWPGPWPPVAAPSFAAGCSDAERLLGDLRQVLDELVELLLGQLLSVVLGHHAARIARRDLGVGVDDRVA